MSASEIGIEFLSAGDFEEKQEELADFLAPACFKMLGESI